MFKKYSINEKDFLYYREDKNDLSPLKEVFEGGHYKKLKTYIIPGATVLDLGAHIGSFTKHCNVLGASCISFEPNKENFELLCKNVSDEINGLFNSAVTVEPVDKLKFYFNATRPQDCYRFTKIASPFYKGTLIVNNTPVDNLLNIHFDVVKMDIEGSEFGIIDSGKMFDCDVLYLEYHFSKDRNMKNFRDRIDKLKQHFTEVSCHPYLLKPDYFKGDKFAYRFDEFIFCKK